MWCLCMLLSIHHKYQMGNVRTYGISKYATINCRHGNRCLQNKCHEMRRWQSMSFIIVFFRNWWIHFEYREMEYYDEVMELKNKQPTAVPSVGADIHRTDEEISKTIESIEVRRGRIRFGIFFNQSIRYCIVRMWLDQVLNHRQHHVSPHMNERRESHPNRNRNQRARITQNTQPKVSTTSSGTSWRCRRKLRIYFSTSPGECLPLSLQRMSHADDGAFFFLQILSAKNRHHIHTAAVRSRLHSGRGWHRCIPESERTAAICRKQKSHTRVHRQIGFGNSGRTMWRAEWTGSVAYETAIDIDDESERARSTAVRVEVNQRCGEMDHRGAGVARQSAIPDGGAKQWWARHWRPDGRVASQNGTSTEHHRLSQCQSQMLVTILYRNGVRSLWHSVDAKQRANRLHSIVEHIVQFVFSG